MAKRKKQEPVEQEKPQEDEFRKELFDTLAMFKIEKLTVHYSGSGDSGQTDDVTTQPANRSDLLDEVMQSGKTIRDAVDEFAWSEGIESHQGGFYNNDGGYGAIIFDVKDRTITMAHNNYITETVYEEYDL